MIATEEDSDDPQAITELAKGLGLGYRAGCGTCYVDGTYLHPQMLFLE